MTLVMDLGYAAYFVGSAVLVMLSLSAVVWPRVTGWGYPLAAVVTAFGLVGIVARSLVSGHLPIFGTFENTWTSSLFLMVGAVVVGRVWAHYSSVWRWAAPWTLVLLVYGSRFRKEPLALTISEQSIIIDVHVLFAWFAFTCLLCVTMLSASRVVKRLPAVLEPAEAATLHDRLLLVGFLAYTIMICLGAFYLWVLFAVPWKWDVVGSVALLAWLLYAMLIHGRLFYRWRSLWYDVAVVSVLPVLLASYWVWSVFPATYHFFDIPLIRPY